MVTNLTQNAESVSLRFRLQENCIETSGFGTLAAGSDPGALHLAASCFLGSALAEPALLLVLVLLQRRL